ncbi:MAG: histidine kinase dimerization/phosphoacceptor domain -containing protein [Balneolaceae bacterium]|nr:histidine kinase dimerization/phosphoacceptor domain -containing protein [Balneolaceae bacterium]
MANFWDTYKSRIYANCTSAEVEQNSIQYSKNQLFAALAVYLIPLSLIALVPGVYVALKHGLIGLLAADFITIGIILGVILLPGISIFVRKVLFNAALYFISLVMLHYLGSNGPGMLYLLTVTIFVVLTLHQFYGYVVLALNTLSCLFFALAIQYEFASTILLAEYQVDTWIGVSSNLIFLSGAAVFLIPHLFKSLQSSFDEQALLREKLEESLDELKYSEQKFKALVQDGSDLIAILDEEANYKYVAPTAESVLGITADEFIGTNALDYIHPDDQEQIGTIISNIASEEEVEIPPFRFRDNKGNWRWIETIITNMMENPAVEGFVANSRDVTEQIERERELSISLKEKETLLAEIHHRVKNNLAIVTSMMELQAMDTEQRELQDSLRVAQQRIRTIASIHELLYGAKSLSHLNFGENIKLLIRDIEEVYDSSKEITVTVDADHILMNINQAIPCALLVNEVVTNAYKHAFKHREEGEIEVKLQENNEEVVVTVKDNGVGLPNDFMKENTSSIGMTLIKLLKQQLDGEIKFSSANGTQFVFTFKKMDVKGIGSNLKENSSSIT